MIKDSDNPQEFRFNLGGAFAHDRFPMKRLSEYLRDFAELFGEEDNVHFIRLEEGSTILVARTQPEFVPVIEDNLQAVARHEAPTHRIAAYTRINHRLQEDGGSGYIIDPDQRKVIQFPGVSQEQEPEPEVMGPFTQLDRVDGMPIRVGGIEPIKSVTLKPRDKRQKHILVKAEESVARQIAEHLWKTYLRIEGTARLVREADGKWIRRSFRVARFDPLPDISFDEDLAKLQAIPGKWKELEDPLGELDLIRHDDEIQ